MRSAVRPTPSASDSEAVCQRVEKMPQVMAAGCIALFASLADEPSPRRLFDVLRSQDKRCLFPQMTGQVSLEFREVHAWEDLRPGRYGVCEPSANCDAVCLSEADVVVVPGVAFDRSGGRLGRGRGYYDRALAELRRSFVIGLALESQVVDEVPRGSLDQLVDAVVTEQRVLSRER
jgi:5-formyltetrahydrofolate cyclo-ligase